MFIRLPSFRRSLHSKDPRQVLAVTVHDGDESITRFASHHKDEHVINQKKTVNVGGIIIDVWISVVRKR